MAFVVFLVGILGLAGCYAFCVMFAHELAERLLAPMAYGRSQEAAARTPATGTVSWVHVASVSSVTAALAGIGTALITVALELGTPSYWLVPVVCASAGAGWSALTQVRRSRDGDRFAAVRRWAARQTRTDLVTAVLWLSTSAVMGVIVLVMFMGVTRPSITDLAAAGILGLSFLTGPAGMLLRHGNRRRRLHDSAPT